MRRRERYRGPDFERWLAEINFSTDYGISHEVEKVEFEVPMKVEVLPCDCQIQKVCQHKVVASLTTREVRCFHCKQTVGEISEAQIADLELLNK